VEYKLDPQHAVADALSRLPTEGLDTGPISQEIPTVGVTTRSGAVLDPRLHENWETARIPLGELAQKQADDEFCQEVKQLLYTSEPTRFYQNADGLLYREGHRAGSHQLLIPRSPVKDVLRAEHSSPLSAHPGGSRMYQTLRDRYYWPSLAADVFGWVAACPTCAKNRLMGTQSTAPMRLFPATEPFAALAIDLLGPLPRTPEEYEYILVICDRFTKVTRAVPLNDISLWMSSAPSWTLGLQVTGSPSQFYRTTDPNSPPYSGRGCSKRWVLTPITPRLTTPKRAGKSNCLIRILLSNYDTP